jgi:hypothetical protein
MIFHFQQRLMDDGRGQAQNCCDPLKTTQHTRVRARVPSTCLPAILLYPRHAVFATSNFMAIKTRGVDNTGWQPEDCRKCLTGLATAINPRDCLGSYLPVSALSCLVLPCCRHRYPVHSPFDMHSGPAPDHATLAEANIGGIGVLQTPLRSGMAHITPRNLIQDRYAP